MQNKRPITLLLNKWEYFIKKSGFHVCFSNLGLDCEIDISKSIQIVRAQRSGMVQTEVC